MSSTLQKHDAFVSQPLGYKSVKCVPGIDQVTGDNLIADGYPSARNLLGIQLNMSQIQFMEFMK